MIHVVDLEGETTRVSAQLAGDDVVVLAFVCPSQDSARRLLGRIDGRLNRRRADTRAAPTPAAIPAPDPFAPGSPVRLSTWAWDRGEMAIDATVVRRVSADRLQVRTKMGVLREVHQRDLERGRRAG